MVLSAASGWRCVIVPPPNPLAAIGGALRQAFPVDDKLRLLIGFESLLQRLRAIH